MIEDYIIGKQISVLFLSFKYHKTYPKYIEERMLELYRAKKGANKILLLKIEELDELGQLSLDELYVQSSKFNFTVIMAWTDEEAARYLHTLNQYKNKTDTILKGWEGTAGGHQGNANQNWNANQG